MTKRSRDPTGTAGIRRRFRAAANARLARWIADARTAVVDNDMLMLAQAFQHTRADLRLRTFSQWVYAGAVLNLVGDSSWVVPFAEAAYASGVQVAAKMLGAQPTFAMDPIYAVMAEHEMYGIVDRTTQLASRAAANALIGGWSPRVLWQEVLAVMRKASAPLEAMANTIVVTAHNEGRIDQFRVAGVAKVAIDPELLVVRRRTHDARENLRGTWNVQTAGDELVCEECEDLAAGGPYDLDEVEGMLPAHANCRCTIIPAWDERFAGNRQGAAAEEEEE